MEKRIKIRCNKCGHTRVADLPDNFLALEGAFYGYHTECSSRENPGKLLIIYD